MGTQMDYPVKITILGAGAIGCTLAARLILAGHSQVSLIARGENLRVLKSEGIYLRDCYGEHHVKPAQVVEQATELGPQDVVFIATKANALSGLAHQLVPLLHAHTMVIPLINGIPFWYFYEGQKATEVKPVLSVDPDQVLLTQYPLQQIIGAVVFITAEQLSYGRVQSSNPYLLIFGEPNHRMSRRLKQLQALFEGTQIEARLSKQIRDQIWTKVIANLSSNPLSVITGATLRDIYSHPYLHDITLKMTHEIRQVAASYGARVSIDPKTFLNLGRDMGDIHTSMWYDYQKKQPLELNSIAQAVLELAEHYECDMPMTRHICQLTQYISEKSRQQDVKQSA